MDIIKLLWREFPLSYDWNPQRIALRDTSSRYRLARYGGFAVLTCPAPGVDAEASLLWGRGSVDDLSAALAGRSILRSDYATVEHVRLCDPQIAAVPARNFDDYIYDLTQQTQLAGKNFGRRRTYLSALERTSKRVEFAELDLDSAIDVGAMANISSTWMESRSPEGTVDDEYETLSALLRNTHTDDLTRAVGLRIDGELEGFAIYDLLGSNLATAHFVKAHRSSAAIAGTWQALFTSAINAGATHLNGGYDGGIDGLRAAKEGLRPQSFRGTYFVVAG